jgi:hypothetical protein
MKNIIISLFVLFGTIFTMNAQDRLVLRNGRTIEVNIQRSHEDRIEYTYPGESTVYERSKSAVSAIYYKDGRKEILDESMRDKEVPSSNRNSTPSVSNRDDNSRANSQTNKDGILWQDVKTTFTAEDVNDLKRLQRVTATSRVSYKDAILQLKKKAAEIGGTTVLVMDDPDNTEGEEIEVIGIAYRDESIPAPKPTAVTPSRESTSISAQTPSNTRHRRILQQMESYNNDSKLDLSEPTPRREHPGTTSTTVENTQKERANAPSDEAPDAVHLLSGRVIYGIIEEFEPDDFVSIRTNTGKVYEYSMDDVRRVQRGSTGKSGSRSSTSARTSSRQNIDNEYNDEYNDRQNRRPARNNDGGMNHSDGSVNGYKGAFDLGYTLPVGVGEKGRLEVHTSHGYQLNDYLFVGVGMGLHVYSARDMNLKYAKIGGKDNYPHYAGSTTESGGNTIIRPDSSKTWIHGVDSSFMILPIFFDIRGYYPMGKISPFVMLRLGYSFNLTDGFGGMGLYMNPAVGIKYNISPKLGVTFSAGYSIQNYGGIPGNDYDGGYGFYYIKKDGHTYEATKAGGLTLKLGVEF